MDDFMTEFQSDEFSPAEFAPLDVEEDAEDTAPYNPDRADWLGPVKLIIKERH